jgi:acyl carrier protein
MQRMTHEDILGFIIKELTKMKADGLIHPDATVGEESVLIGSSGIIDSQNLVNLLLALEDHIDATYGQTFDWSNDRAMSAKRSPFRTPVSLADFAVESVAS